MPGLIRGVARTAVVAGTATAVSNRVSRRQAGRWAEQEQPAPPAQGSPPPPQGQPQRSAQPAPVPAPSPAADDMDQKLAQIEQLGTLKDRGLLSDDEFQAQKRAVLGS
jgi:hypothetical protein